MKYINPFKPLKIKPIKISFNFDTDRDGVKDKFDCQPFNFWKQDTYEQFVDSQRKYIENTKFIKIIGNYGIHQVKGPNGEQLYCAMNMNTGINILNNYSSLQNIINAVKAGVPQEVIQENPNMYSLRAEYEAIQRNIMYTKKYGNKAFRFQGKPGQLVLDIGAGSNPDIRATHAIDLRPPHINFPQINYKSGYDFNNPSTKLPYPNNSFDIVVSYGALGRNFETPQIYKEIYRILKPGGWYETNGWWNRSDAEEGLRWIQQAGFRNIQQLSYFDELLNDQIPVWRAFK